MQQDSPIQHSQSRSQISIIILEKVDKLLAEPYSLNSVSEQIIKQAAQLMMSGYTYSNKQNFTIPVSIITDLLQQISSCVLHNLGQNQQQIQQDKNLRYFRTLLIINTLRMIMNSTFKYDEGDNNKLIQVIYMLYGVQVNKMNKQLHVDGSIEQITYMIALSWIAIFRMNKDQRIYSVCPEIFRFVNLALNRLVGLFGGKSAKNQKKKSQENIKIFRFKQQQEQQQLPNQTAKLHSQTQNNGAIQKQKLLDKYNFSQKKKQYKLRHSKDSPSMNITQLLALYFKYTNQEITEQNYIQILIFWVIHLYQEIIRQAKRIGVTSKSLYNVHITHYIQQNLLKLTRQPLNTKIKNIYLKDHLTNCDIDYESQDCEWQQIDIDYEKKIQQIFRKIKKYSIQHKKQEERDGQVEIEEQIEDDESSVEGKKQIMIFTRQLTPKTHNDEEQGKLKSLRQKKKKLKKKIQSDIRRSTFNGVQEAKVLEDVRAEKLKKKAKKQGFIMQKQTQEAKKFHNKAKKIKKMEKEAKGKKQKNKK